MRVPALHRTAQRQTLALILRGSRRRADVSTSVRWPARPITVPVRTVIHPFTPAGHRRDSGGTAAGPLDPFPLLRGRRAIAGIAELPLRGFDRVDKPLILNLIQPLARFVLRAPALSKLLTELKAKVKSKSTLRFPLRCLSRFYLLHLTQHTTPRFPPEVHLSRHLGSQLRFPSASPQR